MPDGKNLLVLSTESGEVEFWKVPANGIGAAEQLTTDGKVLRWEGVPSPDGKWIAHQDKDNQLWLLDTATKANKRIRTMASLLSTRARSSRTCAGRPTAAGSLSRRSRRTRCSQIYALQRGDRRLHADHHRPLQQPWARWSPDGKWIYFLSDRSLKSTVMSAVGLAPAGSVLRPRRTRSTCWRCKRDCARPSSRPTSCIPTRRTERAEAGGRREGPRIATR